MEKYIGDFFDILTKYSFLKTLIFSLGLVVFFLVVRTIFFNAIKRKKINKVEKTVLFRKVSQYLSYFLILCIFLLWFSQLQVFFVSIFAIAAAIVVALKELIMCLTGGTLVNISSLFKVGHRIEVDGVRGFVIEKSLLTTKILEIGPEKNSQQTTGDIVSIPNSLMLSKSLKNESYFKGYSIKSFIFKIQNVNDIKLFEQAILEVAINFCREYIEEAKVNISNFCDKEGLIVPSINPKTKILLDDGKDFSILIKIPIRNTQIADVEQELNRFFLNWKITHEPGKEEV